MPGGKEPNIRPKTILAATCPPGGHSCPSGSGPHCNEWKGKCPGMVECSSATEAEGTTVLLPQQSPFYFKPGDNPLQLYAAWPGEQLSLSSPPALLKIARDTVRLSDCWNEGNAPPEVYPAAVRIGFDTDALYGNLTATLGRFLAQNGPSNTKGYSSTYLAMGFANVREGTR